MAYAPPPRHYPPIAQEANGEFVITQPWHVWFLNLGRNLGIEQTTSGALGVRLTAVEGEVDALQAASAAGYTGSVTLAKITALGADGSLTVSNGLITAVTAPT